jgi:Nuclease-related domain
MSRKGTRSPLDRMPPARSAGQSLTEEMDNVAYDHLLTPLMLAVYLVLMAAFEWWRWYKDMKPNPWVFTGAAVLAVVFAIYKVSRTRARLQNLKLGRDGERAVAEHLEWLRREDFVVFHDVPNGDANIDHVLIGPQGVFTIETKTLSKPARGRCTITLEGGTLRANGRPLDRNPLIQAKAQAGWLRSFLVESQFRAHVHPVVIFPGWFVEPFNAREVGAWVLEVKALKAYIANEPERHSLEEVKAMASALRSHVRSLAKK